MAKIKVRPHPGALSALLKQKGMTQVDAKEASSVDRKTLAKIDRGEEVKRETLQKLANKLNVPAKVFDPPRTEVVPDVEGDPDDPVGSHTLMLRKLDAERLAEIIKDAEQVHWHLNVQVIDQKARQVLEEFEGAVNELHHWLTLLPSLVEDEGRSLRFQLQGLSKAEKISSLLDQLAELRLTVLGANYLFWELSQEIPNDGGGWSSAFDYKSYRIVLLSIEPHVAESRRVRVSCGSEPPPWFDRPRSMFIRVNGRLLPTIEELSKEGRDAQ
jgi:transcriptional regulator with XRE-family HTH domain